MKDDRFGVSDRAEVFKASDGATLVAQVFRPEGTSHAALVLNGATGVPQDYYRHFARYAAGTHGLTVMTYDYRDMERSSLGPVRKARAKMSDWGLQDQQAARAKMRRMFPDLPIWVMGHSLGGMTLPMQRDLESVERVITVASGNVHHGDHPWPYRAMALMFWFGAGPLAAGVLGYLPGKALGLGSDLPSPAYWQWRKWCTSQDMFGGEAGRTLPAVDWDQPGIDVRMIAFADDQVIPPVCVERHAANFGLDATDVDIIDPRQYRLPEIGHIGVFARRNSAAWDDLLR